MAPPKTAPPSPEIVARARQDYLAGRRVEDICKDYELTQFTLYIWLDGGPASAAQRLPPLPRRAEAKATRQQRLGGSRDAVVRRLWRTAERQVLDIENRLIAAGQVPEERERDARIMAVVVRALADLSALDQEKANGGNSKRGARSPKAAEHHDNASDNGSDALDIHEFRRELARRIAALAADEGAAADGGNEPA